MAEFYTMPGWLEIVRRQEELLRFPAFTRDDALALGLSIAALCKKCGSAAIEILEDDAAVFSFKMAGTGPENELWMRRKLAASRRAGMSSLRVLLEEQNGAQLLPKEAGRAGCYAACGGCFPLRMQDGELRGWLLVSGLHHYEDHQVIAEALSRFLGVPAPAVTEV